MRNEQEFQGKRVLDTGCGTGKHFVVLALLGADVTAVELAEANQKRGNRLKARYRFKNLRFQQRDHMNPLPYKNEFDLVSAHNWMQHAENPSQVFRTLCSTLKIGARFYLSFYLLGTFRLFVTQIARSVLKQEYYETGCSLVKLQFPLGFMQFVNPDDIYMGNIFGDFFVPYCNCTTYAIELREAQRYGLKPITPSPDTPHVSSVDNLALCICFEYILEPVSEGLGEFDHVVDDFEGAASEALWKSIALSKLAITKYSALNDPYLVTSFCLGLYRVRAETNKINSVQKKHEAVQAYLSLCLDGSLKGPSYFYDTGAFYKHWILVY